MRHVLIKLFLLTFKLAFYTYLALRAIKIKLKYLHIECYSIEQ